MQYINFNSDQQYDTYMESFKICQGENVYLLHFIWDIYCIFQSEFVIWNAIFFKNLFLKNMIFN